MGLRWFPVMRNDPPGEIQGCGRGECGGTHHPSKAVAGSARISIFPARCHQGHQVNWLANRRGKLPLRFRRQKWWLPIFSPFCGTPAMQGSSSFFCLTFASRVARIAARAATSIAGAGKLGLGAGILDDQPQNIFETVMACLVQEIGLGGGEKNAVDAAAQKSGED